MVNYARIQSKIDRGISIAGKKVGTPHAAYRLNADSTGDFPSAWGQIATAEPFYKQRVKDSKIESAMIASAALWWEIQGNVVPYVLGDVFMQSDAAYSPGVSYGAGATSVPGALQFEGFALAWHPAIISLPIAGRIDRRVGIYRPSTAPSALPDGSTYWDETHDDDLPLQLVGGQYDFGTGGNTASFIPCGLSSMQRPGSGKELFGDVPGMTKPVRYYAYLPPLPGYNPKEGDALIDEDGARYLVVHPFNQTAGVVGSLLSLEREISENT